MFLPPRLLKLLADLKLFAMHFDDMLSQYSPRDVSAHADIPRAGQVMSTVLSMLTMAVLAVCFTRRLQSTKNWFKIPVTRWLILAIYCDSIIFIFATSILEHGFGLNVTADICSASILLCIACYLSTKLIYYFLIEKVVSSPCIVFAKENELMSNIPYCILVVLCFVYRVSYLNVKGVCIIGMQTKSVMPLIIFDAIVNFYLTLLFVLPLRSLYSYQHSPNSALKTVALRSFFGSLGTLTSSVVKSPYHLSFSFMTDLEVLFSVLVLHWVTSKDSSGGSTAEKSHSHRSAVKSSSKINSAKGSAVDKLRYPHGGIGSSVTTHISAIREAEDFREDEDDLANVELGMDKTKSSGFPLGRITVQVERVREVEGGHARASVVSTTQGLSRGGSYNKSTEDLVERTETKL
ncbi:hypothetical protein D0Z07_7073 [Hyphodiscus hymeniophilus]|uniref:Uncharacterized protein n=1 Tax=Hyphodiscus hymeniophilus TaxID=353542 RepID=A0A9P6VGC5_9HELO|nr:hypothetical protein D0Z07_7073 [Hyphodiscus hymeniophilus]